MKADLTLDRVPGPALHRHARADGAVDRRRVAHAADRDRRRQREGRAAAGFVRRGAPEAAGSAVDHVHAAGERGDLPDRRAAGGDGRATGHASLIAPVTLGRDFGNTVEVRRRPERRRAGRSSTRPIRSTARSGRRDVADRASSEVTRARCGRSSCARRWLVVARGSPRAAAPARTGVRARPPAGCRAGRSRRTPTGRPSQPRDASPRGSWWEIFGDAELNALEAADRRLERDAEGRRGAVRAGARDRCAARGRRSFRR